MEERTKQVTLSNLKRQGEQYLDFNSRVVGVLDEADDAEAEAFRATQKKIETGVHFEERYNLDEMIGRKFGEVARAARSKLLGKRRRVMY